jgi:hypothetical protein
MASDRLVYLAAHYDGELIVGTQTIDDIRDAKDDAAGRNWYVSNSSHTACRTTGGPAEKLEQFIGFTDRPTTNDIRDEKGNIIKVEVVNNEGDGDSTVWTYYRHRADCEREWITRTQDLAARYR